MPAVGDIKLGCNVVGVKDLVDRLERMGIRLSGTAVRRALYQGAKVFRDDARQRAPFRTGALRKAIVAETEGFKVPGQKKRVHVARVTIARKAYTIGARGTAKLAKPEPGQSRPYKKGQIYPRNYAHLVEFGTAPHGYATREGVHPGSSPKPFMRPALDSQRAAALRAVSRQLVVEAEKAVGRKVRRLAG